MPHHERLVTAAHRTASIAACASAIVGVTVIWGWILDVQALKSVVPGLGSLKFNAAIGFVLAGASLWLLREDGASRAARVAGGALGVVVALLATLTLVEWIFAVDLGIDSLFYDGTNPRWGRPPPHSASAFFCVGAWLCLLPVRRTWGYRCRACLSVIAGLIILQTLIGYVYGVRYLYGSGEVNRMSLQAITTLGVMCLGLLAARPREGFVALLTSVGPGGVVARRLTPAVLLAPVVIGGLRLAAQEQGLIDLREGLAIMAEFALVGLGAIVVYTGFSLNRADAERRALAAQAEQANKAKSEFLSRMSHELRTPLHAILGFGRLLERDELPAAQHDQLAQITSASRHLLELINEVLDITRIERGGLRPSLEPVHLGRAVHEALDMVSPLAASRSLATAAALDDPGVHVLADRQRLKQVLLNLLSNAVKYNREGGEVTVRATSGGSPTVRIEVIDTGIGIAHEDLGRAFAAFDRIGADGTAVEGTGLGLALTKQLVEAMGGEIGVESETGHGATFWFELAGAEAPAVQQEQSLAEPPDEAALAAREARTVLYVEDNPSNIELVKAILQARPEVALLVATEGGLGLQLAREHRPALVLLDLNLPDISGTEVLRRIRGDARTADLAVVILSADAAPGQSERLRRAGADDYLAKPFEIEQFLAVIDGSAPPRGAAGAPQEAAG